MAHPGHLPVDVPPPAHREHLVEPDVLQPIAGRLEGVDQRDGLTVRGPDHDVRARSDVVQHRLG